MAGANALDTQAPAIAYAFMICLFIGFAVKLPVFPLHGWFPDAHAQADPHMFARLSRPAGRYRVFGGHEQGLCPPLLNCIRGC